MSDPREITLEAFAKLSRQDKVHLILDTLLWNAFEKTQKGDTTPALITAMIRLANESQFILGLTGGKPVKSPEELETVLGEAADTLSDEELFTYRQ